MRQPLHPDASEISLPRVLGALADPVRLGIMEIVADGREHPFGDFSFGLAKSTLSHHVKLLREAGLVWARVEGTRCFLSLRSDVDHVAPGLLKIVLDAQPSVCAD
jgi:DNA-binding transcriptional ArsR family regulator